MLPKTLPTITLERSVFSPAFWAVLLFLSGLFFLDLPFHGDHVQRQAVTATIARNFYELGLNPMYPTMNICGETSPNYFATEFPFLQILMTFGYYIFGEEYWIGRLINWAVYCLGLWFFAGLCDKLMKRPVGLFSMLFMVGSIATMFGRKIMPDTFSVALVTIGVYFLYDYLQRGRHWWLILGGVLVALGVLSKIPSVVVICLLSVPVLTREISWRRKVNVFVVLGIGGLLSAGWYFAWMPHLQALTRCAPLIYPVSLAEGFRIFFFDALGDSLHRFHILAFCGPIPAYLFLAGVALAVYRREWKILAGTLAYALIFLLFIFKTGPVFSTHNYYVIPFIPLMALYAGKMLSQPWLPRWLALVIVLGLAYQPLSYGYRDINLVPEIPALELDALLTAAGVPKDELIMVHDVWMNPTNMYYAHRRGWFADGSTLDHHNWMVSYRRLGLRFLVVDKSRYDKPLPYYIITDDEVFRLYDVTKTPEGDLVRD
ncbi:glycosyltransferase family 39 protein [Neolewinella lacunae]|uniref:Glycosyltransferase family 39 protein n=1 Tax=Neolewinella lacunae TaxID=1517758 RepID=A0A923TCN0_9BACT|nr:glycosyltransferase family 39 protein [Neolewinella lacunae]MBC6993912.1 glycosyltransferase family 39 protein [Neolewinella lacunae]MDN3635006.1 glycosyltransferase family 39 protein [Neolewinella lacunae]